MVELVTPKRKFTQESFPGTLRLLAHIPPLLWGAVYHDTLWSCPLALRCSDLLSLTLPKVAFYGCWFRFGRTFPPSPDL